MESEKTSDTYTRSEIRRILGIKENSLRSWERAGLTAAQEGYSFTDLVSLKTLQNLRSHQIPPKEIAEAIRQLRTRFDHIDRPLDELKIVSDGRRIAVELPGERIEALTGQMLFDFRSGSARAVTTLEQDRGTKDNGMPGRGEASLFQYALDLERSGERPSEIIDVYRKILALNPRAAGAWVNVGTLHHREGRLHDAESSYKEALAIFPEYALAHFNLGNVCEETNRLAEAAEHYESALVCQCDYADAHFNLAVVYERRGQVLRAAKHWRLFLKLDASSPWAKIARRKLEHLPTVAGGDTPPSGESFRKPSQGASE